MKHLRQSTASQTITIGPFIDDTDFKTTENALTIANTDIKLKKNGATAVNKNSGGGTNDVNGMVAITLDATDTNTVGELNISVKVAGALVVFKDCEVLEEPVYDLKYGASATGDVKLQGITHTSAVIPTVTTTTTATNLTNLPSIPANWITAAGINAAALNGKGDWNIGKTGYTATVSAINANVITAAAIQDAAITAAKLGADCITEAKLSPGACNQIAAHNWRITIANIEADTSADAIVNGTPSAYMIPVAHCLQYDVVASDIVYKNNAGTSIGKRAITVDGNGLITTIAKMIAA